MPLETVMEMPYTPYLCVPTPYASQVADTLRLAGLEKDTQRSNFLRKLFRPIVFSGAVGGGMESRARGMGGWSLVGGGEHLG